MALRRDSHITLYMQLAEQIEREIASGKYGPHDRLPTEQQFVDALGVSRITVRQALNHLAKGGLIVKKQGKGTFVAGPVVRHELQDLRGILEEITSQGIEPETRLLHFGPVTAPAGTLEELRINVRELVLLERLYSLQGEPIGLARTYFAPFSPEVTWERANTHRSDEILEDLVGTPIGSADLSIRGRLAGREIAKVLKMSATAPLLVFERLSFSEAGAPLESTRFYVKSESYEFTFKVKGAMPLTSTLEEAI